MTAKTPALVLRDVTLTHGDGEEIVTALDDVTLEVAPGEFVAVVGPSGSGKSSLLAVAGALTTPTSGSVRLGEVDLVAATPRQRTAVRRERIGYVFQSDNLVPALTALDQIRLPATFTRGGRHRDAAELLTAVGMDHKAGRRPHQLLRWRTSTHRHRARPRQCARPAPGRRADRRSRPPAQSRHRRIASHGDPRTPGSDRHGHP
ncbi:MAG: ATP-binding cassette domain-containing protein [Nocardioides sp.]